MNKIRIQTAMHTAVLDPLEGVGLLVTPLPEQDVRLSDLDSMIEADWSAIVRRLIRDDGWSFAAEDDWGIPEVGFTLPDGRRGFVLIPYLTGEAPDSVENQARFADAAHRLLAEISG